jgi:hypothetical protein
MRKHERTRAPRDSGIDSGLARHFVPPVHPSIRCPSLPRAARARACFPSLHGIKPKTIRTRMRTCIYIYICIYSLSCSNRFYFSHRGRTSCAVRSAAVYVGGPYYKALHYANSSRISVRRDKYLFVPFYPFLSSALSSSSPKRKRARAPRLKARNP